MSGPLTSRLRAKNELVEDVHLPADFAAALLTQRIELLKCIHRPLSVSETESLAHAFGVLIKTNMELQNHCEQLAHRIDDLRSHAKGVVRSIERIDDLANFREPLGGEDDG